MKRKCATCVHSTIDKNSFGVCLRYPPVPINTGQRFKSDVEFIRPRVGPNDICGEYQKMVSEMDLTINF